ncbi:MAG: hypothetical protein C4524_13080 [Candidatus Zixiibacteriota bacterium]|nr:MAG: hypothetical protein C4524_13080 [candidate division Zixibacteria bacterium]
MINLGNTVMRHGKLILLLALLPAALGLAQNRLPQDYVAADELVTLSSDMTFDQAFMVLSKVSYAKEGRTIIDPLKHQGRIELDIVNLPWRKAFEVILKAHRLGYVAHEKFFEVTGGAENVAPDKQEISLLTREVRIDAIFFEADRRALSEAGVDWSVLRLGNELSAGLEVNGATQVTEEIFQGDVNYSTTQNGIDYNITALLKAFESQNLGRILAQPQVVVVSGREGRVQVGQDFSIKTRDFAGNVLDNFFSTGTILTVTPVAFSENGVNFVHLSLHAERSSAQPGAVSTIINKSQANTQVLLVDGESTMVGGLLSRDYKMVRKGVPFLKDLPWYVLGLRYVFGYNLSDGVDRELIVILKAQILPELKARATTPGKSLNELFEQRQNETHRELNRNWEAEPEVKFGE